MGSLESVLSASPRTGTNRAFISKKRHNKFPKEFGGRIGSRTHGASTPFRVFKTLSCHQRYPSVKWGDRSVLSDFSLSLAGCSRSHELRPHSLKGRTDSRRGSPSISHHKRPRKHTYSERDSVRHFPVVKRTNKLAMVVSGMSRINEEFLCRTGSYCAREGMCAKPPGGYTPKTTTKCI